MSRFFVRLCGHSFPEFNNLSKESCSFIYFEDAVIFAEEMLAKFVAQDDDALATFVVFEEDRYLLASFTNRPITVLLSYEPKTADALKLATNIDALHMEVTSTVLQMSLDELHYIKDPHIGNSIREYFGVYSLEDVTLRALNFARCREAVQKVVEETVTIQVKLKLQTTRGTNIAELVKNIDVGFNPRVVGSIILGKEITRIN
jgi:hypothetical protein